MDQGEDVAGNVDDDPTDENYQWSELVRGGSDQQQPSVGKRTMGSLNVYDPAMVTMGRQIGEGAQGVIFEAKFYLPFCFQPLPVVVKKFKPQEGVSQGQFPPEMAAAKCVSVCKPLGVVFQGESLCVIMPRYSCDLRSHIDAHMHALQADSENGYTGPPFRKFEAEHMLLQLAVGMKGLHESGIYHRDLKAANILVNRHCHPDGRPCPLSEVHVTDFERSDGVAGTGFYRAPEVLLSLATKAGPLSHHDWMMADVYSFGMVCYEVLTGRTPFDGHPHSDHSLVLDGARPELPDHVPRNLANIMRRCWQADPSSRPSWSHIVKALSMDSEPRDSGRRIRTKSSNFLTTLDPPAKPSIQADVLKLKSLIHDHTNACGGFTSRGFADYVFWAEEFVTTAEEYISKFSVDHSTLSEESLLLCKWQEFVERRELNAVLFHQFLAYPATTMGLSLTHHPQYNYTDQLGLEENSPWNGREQIRSLMMHVMLSIDSQLRNVRCVGDVDEEMSWGSKVMVFHALIKRQLWTEVICPPFGGASLVKLVAQLVKLVAQDGVEEVILFGCLIVVAILETYLYVLAVFTVEPVLLCLQYGVYRIKGFNNFCHRSCGYRICRLQRAWVNYTRYELLSAALVLSLVYLVVVHRWKGFLAWIVLPSILRFSPHYWRRAILG